MNIEKHPYHLLPMAAVAIAIVGLLSGNSTVDIHLHDTYFVLASVTFIWLSAAALLLLWILYLFTKNVLYSSRLSRIHIFLSILSAVFIAILPYLLTLIVKEYSELSYQNLSHRASAIGDKVRLCSIALIILILAGQSIWFVNLVLGIVHNKRSQIVDPAKLIVMVFVVGGSIACNSITKQKLTKLTSQEQKLCDSLGFDQSIFNDIKTQSVSPIESFHYSLGRSTKDGIEEEIDPIRLRGIVFGAPTVKAYDVVLSLKDKFKSKGYTIFLLDKRFGLDGKPDVIGVLKTTNIYSILKKVQTDGINYDITNDSLLRIIGRFDRKYQLELIGASGDYCEFIIRNPPKNWKEIAEEAYAVCPDIVDQGAGSLEALETEMQKTNRLYFWWD
jgi:hypothetical protein